MIAHKVLIYGDVNMNILDGSAVWAASAAEVLARAGCEVTFLLKAKPTTDRLLAPLAAYQNISLIDPFSDRLSRFKSIFRKGEVLSVDNAVEIIERLHTQENFDAILIRGGKLAPVLAESEVVFGKLWTYLTDFPQSAAAMSDRDKLWLGKVAAASHVMLCQTGYLRALLETAIPESAGKCELWLPIFTDPEVVVSPLPNNLGTMQQPISLVYTGKFAPMWNTLEMTQLPRLMKTRGVHINLAMIGDKVHVSKDLPTWNSDMKSALQNSEGVIWHGGMSRQEAMELSSQSQIGLSWRDEVLDASLELSTKVLEFGSMGLPVILNRTTMHEELFGADYPLFVDEIESIEDVLVKVNANPQLLAQASQIVSAATENYSITAATKRVEQLMTRLLPAPSSGVQVFVNTQKRALRVAVASHDLKFFTKIAAHWQGMSGIELRFDHWPAVNRNDAKSSKAILKWADVIVCEWCGGNALWYAKNKKPKQRLIVRLHRFELSRPWPETIKGSAVNQLVCVSKPYADLTLAKTSVPAKRVVVVPNWVDTVNLDRPKFADAEFTLGMIGASPMRKRPDLAIEALEILRKSDPRFKLIIKSKLPWQMPWVWREESERTAFRQMFERIERSPLLRGSIVFDDYGSDVPNWLRRIGWVLSTSDDESFHLAPAEGAASGAVPVLLPWPGSDQIYDSRWIHQTPQEMADFILETTRTGTWKQTALIAKSEIEQRYGLDLVNRDWTKLLTEDLPPVN